MLRLIEEKDLRPLRSYARELVNSFIYQLRDEFFLDDYCIRTERELEVELENYAEVLIDVDPIAQEYGEKHPICRNEFDIEAAVGSHTEIWMYRIKPEINEFTSLANEWQVRKKLIEGAILAVCDAHSEGSGEYYNYIKDLEMMLDEDDETDFVDHNELINEIISVHLENRLEDWYNEVTADKRMQINQEAKNV